MRLGLAIAASALAVSWCMPASAADVSSATRSSIRQCYNNSPYVWLSFDDGSTPARVSQILSILHAYNVKALFFPLANWAAKYPSTMARIYGEGQVVGNHTYSHPDLTKLTDAQVSSQIRRGVRGNVYPTSLLRPPYGSGAFTTRLYRLAAAQHYELCFWTVDTRDWDGSSAATIVRRVKTGDSTTPSARAGGVVLMHMQGPNTIAALPGIIKAIRAKGLRLPPRQ